MDKWKGVKTLTSQKKTEIKQVIRPYREGMTSSGYPCSLAWNPKVSRYDLRVSERMLFSLVSYEACLRTAEDLEITWEDDEL